MKIIHRRSPRGSLDYRVRQTRVHYTNRWLVGLCLIVAALLEPFAAHTDVLHSDAQALSSILPSILDLEWRSSFQMVTAALQVGFKTFSVDPESDSFNPLPASACNWQLTGVLGSKADIIQASCTTGRRPQLSACCSSIRLENIFLEWINDCRQTKLYLQNTGNESVSQIEWSLRVDDRAVCWTVCVWALLQYKLKLKLN